MASKPFRCFLDYIFNQNLGVQRAPTYNEARAVIFLCQVSARPSCFARTGGTFGQTTSFKISINSNSRMNSIFFNSQHSPVGAFASFTLGEKGPKGGLAVELGKPADQNVFIGLENADGGTFSCLPFFDAVTDESLRFDVSGTGSAARTVLKAFDAGGISRKLSPAWDIWQAGDLEFRIHTPVCPAPDPAASTKAAQKLAYVPALAVEIEVDNRKGKKPRRVFFGYQGNDPARGMRQLDDTSKGKFVGIACGDSTAIASDSPGVVSAQGFTVGEVLEEKNPFNYAFGIGGVGLLMGLVPAGKRVTLNFAVCFFRGGIVTTGMKGCYHYSRLFADIEAVAAYALAEFSALKKRGDDFEKRFQRSRLSDARKFMLAHAIHSYYGSTEFLEVEGEPMWIVNEGEYRMINTFDLTVDHLFFELKLNPWTVANELDWFVKRYSYTDKVRFPGDSQEHRGGLSFTHDMGVANHFSRPGRSVYEKTELHGCFSHMTHEELVNWLICGLAYAEQSGDSRWLKKSLPIFERCLESLLKRDNPDPRQRTGIMALDSSRCSGGSEITTYDSLDVSLGQARNNLYLAVKCWGVYVGLAALFHKLGDSRRVTLCKTQAALCAATICAGADAEGLLPAVLHENVNSRIIPAIEGLIVPYCLGLHDALKENGTYGDLIIALKKHLNNILKPGVCLFADGGWKISSTSDNSWLSKVYLCQFVAEKVVGLKLDQKAVAAADDAHASWLLDERNSYWAWSDQMVSGVARGSKYYPRGVTSVLWLE